MRISKSSFSAEVHSVACAPSNPAFRYLLYEISDGKNKLLYESDLFQEKINCVADADEHLEQLITSQKSGPRVLWSAA